MTTIPAEQPGVRPVVVADGETRAVPADVPPRRPGRRGTRMAAIAALSVFGVLFTYPFVWLVSASLKPRAQVFDNKLIPSEFATGKPKLILAVSVSYQFPA